MKLIYFVGLSVLLSSLLSSCKKDETVNIIDVEFRSTESFQIRNKSFKISIYGYDPNWQDVSASLITQQEFEASQVPFSIKIKIPEDPEKNIEYLNDKDYAKYYLHLDWDSDGNNKVCKGDITLDYSKFPEVKLDKRSKQSFLVKSIPSTTLCN